MQFFSETGMSSRLPYSSTHCYSRSLTLLAFIFLFGSLFQNADVLKKKSVQLQLICTFEVNTRIIFSFISGCVLILELRHYALRVWLQLYYLL